MIQKRFLLTRRIFNMVSKKYYEAIAEILAGCKFRCCNCNYTAAETVEDIAVDLADYFKQDNPRFDADKFHTTIFKGV